MNEPSNIDPTLPPIVRKFLASGARLESIRLDADGVWWHQGAQFENEKLKLLFSASVDRTEGGTWVLQIPPFTYPIEVEDTGFFIKQIDVNEDNTARLRLAGGSSETLDPTSLVYEEGRGFTCCIREGRFRARFRRSAYYALAERINTATDGTFVLTLGQQQWTIATP